MTDTPKIILERLMETDDFYVWVPGSVDILEKASENIEDTRPIGGFCSTDRLDRQGEVVVQKGLDFGEFVKHGYFNDNHRQGTADILGYPSTAVLKGGRWWTEGNLLKNFGPADKVWELAKALKASGAPRRLGFSIEGKILERGQRNRILRATVRNVAITNCPVNTECTWDVLTKAFAPIEDVTTALNRALAAGSAHPAHAGGSALMRTEDDHLKDQLKGLSFSEAVKLIKHERPHYSDHLCKRIVQFAMSR